MKKKKMKLGITFILIFLFTGCNSKTQEMTKIVFLHHSTGEAIWKGKTNRYVYRLTKRGDVQKYFASYNRKNKTRFNIQAINFPKSSPYGWNNYPFDYYNIWVRNAGLKQYLEEPTLEILTSDYDVIIFKHCFPVSRINPDTGTPDINSDVKSLENYKLQYEALKKKMHEFPDNKFIVWTPAANTKLKSNEDEALRTREFHNWMINEWDEKGDNIFIWDFYEYETEGGLYLTDANAHSPENSHPNVEFASRVAPLFSDFIIGVIKGEK
ncbi:MAG TPA: hypothetical protein PLY21_12055 [Spirochaetota bacterium]|nr:hypothetical protein [Spirochaetota bacterium]